MFHSWFSVSILALVVGLVVGGGGGGEAEDFKLKGPNVCVDQREERKTVNITYLQSQDVKEYTWCLKVPPR